MRISRLACYDPTTAMAEVHKSQSRLRVVRKPNQIGGTIALVVEIWWAALGIHPHRPPIADGPIWLMLANLKDSYITISEKLHQFGDDHELTAGCKYVDGQGYIYRGQHMVMLQNGRRVEFKSGTQNVMALESGTIAAGFIDEPANPLHMGAFMQRCAVNMAPVLLNFTPIGRPLKSLRERIEGTKDEPPKERWHVFRPTLSLESCTTVGGRKIRSAESISAQIESMSPWELAQRRDGEWDGETPDRRFPGFTTACIVDDDYLRAIDIDAAEARLGLDHGEGTGKQCACLTLCIGDAFVIVAEFVAPANSSPLDIADGIADMLDSRGLTPHDISRAFGDINSAGALGGGRKLNAFIEDELAVVYGTSTSPITIESPPKRGGSVNAGEAAINHAAKEGRWLVHESCTALIEAMRHYTGPKDSVYKDPVDTARYSVLDKLLAQRHQQVTHWMQR